MGFNLISYLSPSNRVAKYINASYSTAAHVGYDFDQEKVTRANKTGLDNKVNSF